MNPKFEKGQLVKLVNTTKVGVICEDPKNISGDVYYVLFIENTQKTYSEESLELVVVKNKNTIAMFQNDDFASLKDFYSYLTFIKVERPLSNNLYSFLSSRTEFQVYQFKPVLKYLSSPYQRLLIADEVGVGKTIESGIILTELLSRSELRNVLIVCPSALRYKWQAEMKRRFNEDFALINSDVLKIFFKKYERHPNGVSIKGIVSLQTLRNEEIMDEMERLQIPWDLIFVDEAHHMRNENTRSSKLGKLLSSTSDGMILLSATPLQLGNKDLFNLFNIMLPEMFDNFNAFEEQVKPNEYLNLALRKISQKESPASILKTLRRVEETSQRERFLANPNYNYCTELLSRIKILSSNDIVNLQRKIDELNVLSQIYTRTKKKEISIESPIREPVTIKVNFNDNERYYYQKVENLFLTLYPNCPPGFLLQMPCRQVASCIPASIEYLKEIYQSGKLQLSEEEDYDELDYNYKIILTKGDLLQIESLIAFAENNISIPDSKTISFIKTIQEVFSKGTIKKIIIFSFFKRTLTYLEKQLKIPGLSVLRIDGDVPFIERERILSDFANSCGEQILLSSDVGGEGLDMQFCNCMFNYDLPWNPMKIEQRIGRLDRYGQKSSKIHIYNFSIENTIESDIFLRLCNRIGVFEQYIGELEPILGSEISQLTKDIINTKLTPEQQKAKSDQVALVIEKKKQELELFDKNRSKFLGQDDYFTEQVSDILKNEKFVTSDEIVNLVSIFIEKNYPRSKFKVSSKNEKLYEISLDEDMRSFLKNYIEKSNRQNDSMISFLDLIHNPSFKVTFDYKEANADATVEFITLRHLLLKSIIDFYQNKEFKTTTKVTYFDHESSIQRDYLFFIYLLEISSFKKSLTFVPIVVDLKDKTINSKYSENLLYILKNSIDFADTIDISSEDIKLCEEAALDYMVAKKRQQESELKDINESLVNDRIDSLRQTYDIKLAKLEEIIHKIGGNEDEKSNRILRMRQSQKINTISNFENKKRALESQKKIIISHELICGGYLNVKCQSHL